MAERGAGERGAGDLLARLLDVADELVRGRAQAALVLDASWRDTVEILAANRDTDDEVGEVAAVLLDGGLKGVELVCHDLLTGAAPESEEEGCLGVDGGLEGRRRVSGGTTLDHGVESCAREVAVRALERLCAREARFVVGLCHECTIGFGRAVVEAG